MIGFTLRLLRCLGPTWLRPLIVFYIDSMRAIPVLVVVWTFFAFPILFGITMMPIVAAVGAISVHVAASLAEIVRAGIESIRQGQSWAGLALGMTQAQLLRKIILPQAIKRVLPVLATTWVALFEDTSLVSIIVVSDLAYTAMQIRSKTFRILEMLTAMAVIYWAMGYPQAKLTDWIHRGMAGRE